MDGTGSNGGSPYILLREYSKEEVWTRFSKQASAI